MQFGEQRFSQFFMSRSPLLLWGRNAAGCVDYFASICEMQFFELRGPQPPHAEARNAFLRRPRPAIHCIEKIASYRRKKDAKMLKNKKIMLTLHLKGVT